ncbi:hypothetical protein G3565_37240, partial [Escherichia coli]|nr:hypothetical protein [Escherichia coli]NEU03253.1 hypothetical protein [Escherichia coli]
EDTESKISVVCTYFRLTMDGKELVEIDTINMIEKVNGVDRLELRIFMKGDHSITSIEIG